MSRKFVKSRNNRDVPCASDTAGGDPVSQFESWTSEASREMSTNLKSKPIGPFKDVSPRGGLTMGAGELINLMALVIGFITEQSRVGWFISLWFYIRI